MRGRSRVAPSRARTITVLTVAIAVGNVQPIPPEQAAREFFEALGRLRWEEMAARLHTQTLDEFHLIARQLVDSRAGDSVLIQLYDAPRAEWEAWDARYAFRRTMEGLARYARGLMESQVATEFQVLGTVPEGDSIRHVVYRETTDHMGTTTGGVATISLVLEGGRWQVRANAELEVLKASLRGIPIGRGPTTGRAGADNGLCSRGLAACADRTRHWETT